MILCSAILLVESLRRRKKSEKFSARVPWFLIIGTMSIGSVYAVLFNRIGFIPSTIIFIGAMLFLVNGTRGLVAEHHTYGLLNIERLVLL